MYGKLIKAYGNFIKLILTPVSFVYYAPINTQKYSFANSMCTHKCVALSSLLLVSRDF